MITALLDKLLSGDPAVRSFPACFALEGIDTLEAKDAVLRFKKQDSAA